MAHLRPGDPDPRPESRGRDRAQLLLLAGFALAAVFVAFAFLLNSVIYTENLATRGEAAKTSQAVIVVDDVVTGTEAVVEYANEHNTTTYVGSDPDPYTGPEDERVEDELVSGIADVELLVGTQHLANGGLVSVESVTYEHGTWINQSYRERNFTAGGGTDFKQNWTLFSNADGVRAYEINVTEPDRLENTNPLGADGSARNFTVVAVDSDGDTWEMQVFYHQSSVLDGIPDSSYVVRTTDGDGDTRFCTVPDSSSGFRIDVSAGTLAGKDCRALRFGEDIGEVQEIRHENGDQAYGTYRLMAARDVTSVDLSVYNGTGAPPPVVEPAIYNATIRVSFETDNLFYETDRVVEPEAGDDA